MLTLSGYTATLSAADLTITAVHDSGYRTGKNEGRHRTIRFDRRKSVPKMYSTSKYKRFGRSSDDRDASLLTLARHGPNDR